MSLKIDLTFAIPGILTSFLLTFRGSKLQVLLGFASGFFLFYAKNDGLVPLFNFNDLMAASLSEKATLQCIKVLLLSCL
jgi:hypothetical protein